MNALLFLAQVGESDPAADTPLKKALWYTLLPLGILILIFGGGFLLLRAEQRAKRERDRSTGENT